MDVPVQDTWKLEGFDEFNDFNHFNRALLAAYRSKTRISNILKKEDPVAEMEALIKRFVRKEDEELLSKVENDTFQLFQNKSLHMIKLTRKAKESIEALHERGYKMGVATVPKTEFSKRWLKENIGDYFDPVVGSDRYKDKKDGILRCCRTFGLLPAEVAMVGDATTDIINGREAGCKTVALLRGMGMERFLRAEHPDFVFKDLCEMAEHFTGGKD
jgi:pyrophosphatase PpaX